MPISWLDDYFEGPDWDAIELADSDEDGFPAWMEYIALTDPTNSLSFFVIRAAVFTASGVEVSFDTAAGRVYTVQHSTGLQSPVWSNAGFSVIGDGGRMTVTVPLENRDTYFYRVRVTLP